MQKFTTMLAFTKRSLPASSAFCLTLMFWCLSCATAQDVSIESAEKDLKEGKYSNAVTSFTRLLQANPNDGRAQKGVLTAYLETGKYAEAESNAKRFVGTPGNEAQSRLFIGEVLAITGRYPEAISEFEKTAAAASKKPEAKTPAADAKKTDAANEDEEDAADNLRTTKARADLRRAEILELTGKRDAAQPIYESFIKYYEDTDALSAEDLTIIAQALVHLERYKDANEMFDDAINADAELLEAHLSRGELFTAKYNYQEAAEILSEAAKINPNSARLHLAIASNKRIEGGDEMNAALAQSLKINPNYVEAKIFHASLDLESEKYAAASTQLDEVLKINPNSLDAHSLRAARFWLEDKQPEFNAEVKAVTTINPLYGPLYETLAHFATQTRRYEESIVFLREAIKLSPNLYSSHLALGMNLLRLGRKEEGRAAVELAFKGDPFNLWAKNTLDLLDTMKEYGETKSGDFLIRAAAKENDVLSVYASELLTEAQKTLTSKYQFTPKGPITVEIFPNHEDFAVSALGLPGLGALGVCFGPLIAQDSPSARAEGEFNWGSTMWHEYAHVITLQTTNNLIPRWFSEGLSVFEEHKARPGWGDDWNIGHIKAFSEGRWFTIANLDNGFIRPKKPEDIGLAYFEASQICHFIEEKFGFNALIEMLRGYREKKKTPEILKQTLKYSEADFDREFNAYIKGKIDRYIKALEPMWKSPMTGQAAPEELAKRAQDNTTDFGLNIRAGLALYSAGDADKAIPFLKRSIELFPFQGEKGGAYEALAEIYEKRGDKAAQAEMLDALVKVDENNYQAVKKLAGLKLEAGDKARGLELLKMSFYINPFEHSSHTMMGSLLLDQNQNDQAIREFQVVLASNPPNQAEAQYNLARAYYASGKTREARRSVLKSLESAPSFDKAQELLLKIKGQ